MRPMIAAVLLLALAACQPQDPDGAPAPPPADAPPPAPAPAVTPTAAPTLPPAFTGDLDAVGTEPFWSVTIRKAAITLTRPDMADVAAAPGPATIAGDTATWTQTAGGKAFVVVLSKGDCSDGMSDRSFPLTAQVKVGDLTLDGCAARTADLPKGQ